MLRSAAVASVMLAIAGPCTLARAQDLDEERPVGEVQFSDDTIQLRYITSGRKMDLEQANRISGGFFLSESRDIVLMGDVLFPAELNVDRLQFLFGPRAYAALLEDENNDVLAASLGVEVRYELGSSGLAISGQAFYSPDILTFGSANNLTDLSARAEFRIQDRMTIFGGMRWFEFELTDGEQDRTLQEEIFAGAAWRF
jgi:YfaZ precursor